MPTGVLVIDPDENVLAAARRSLARGFAAVTASHGDDGMRLFRDAKPDVVLLEVFMPEKDGIECILEIKREVPQTKVIAMTGGGSLKQDYVLELAVKLGADGILCKPFTARQLVGAIRKVLPPKRPSGAR